jgi:NADH-quinone oxidoreductase subunit L
MEELAHEFHGPVAMAPTLTSLPLWLAIAGVVRRTTAT